MRKNKRPRCRRRTKKRAGLKKFNVTSPTAVTESVLITAAIDEIEVLSVAVINAPGVFLAADMEKEVIVVLEKNMVDAMLEINRKIYGKYIIYRENK